MSPLCLCVETLASAWVLQSALSLPRALTQDVLGCWRGVGGERVSCAVNGEWVVCSSGPSEHFPIGNQASLIRAEDRGGVGGLKVLGPFICGSRVCCSPQPRGHIPK